MWWRGPRSRVRTGFPTTWAPAGTPKVLGWQAAPARSVAAAGRTGEAVRAAGVSTPRLGPAGLRVNSK